MSGISLTSKINVLTICRKFYIKNLTSFASFCTKAAYATQESYHFRTSQNSPSAHTREHIGKLYTIPPDVKNKLFLNEGIPKELLLQMKTFREHSLLVREPFIEIKSLLQKVNYSDPAIRFILYGNTGSGKSTCLVHVLHYGYELNFLLLHCTWVSNWTKRPKEVVSSQYNEKWIDLPVEAVAWLQHFKTQNSDLMAELDLRTTKSYTWSKREVTEQGAPVMDILEHGLQRVTHSSDCVAAILREIKLHSQSGKFKTMVVIDGVNAFWCKTNVKRPDKTLVPPSDITITRAFMKLLQNDWNNAVIITTVDKIPFNRDATMQEPYTPHHVLGKEGFELMTPFVPIHVNYYTDKEFNSMFDYYCASHWIGSERAQSEEGRRQLRFLSGNNPGEFMHLCNPL